MLNDMDLNLFDNQAHPIPHVLEALLTETGCPHDAPLATQRAALESLAQAQPRRIPQLDRQLLWLREAETAGYGLPAVVGGAHRSALLAWDRVSTTWLGWNEQSGARVAVRCLRPRWRKDPVVHRRISLGERQVAGSRGLVPMRFHPHADWPHVAYQLRGVPLSELLPVEDPPSTQAFSRWVVTAVAALERLHHRGLLLGSPRSTQLLLEPDRAALLWLDPLDDEPKDPRRDVAGLARVLLALEPEETHTLAPVLQPWTADPPGSVGEAAEVLRRAMADGLSASRHALALRRRLASRDDRTARLHALCRRLDAAAPPPVGRGCLHAAQDRTLFLIESDGRCVRGGTAVGVPPQGLLPLYTPSRGLDAPATRRMLRAWARRDQGDPSLRASAQRRWEADDVQGEALVRWLAASSRLRRARLLLATRLKRT